MHWQYLTQTNLHFNLCQPLQLIFNNNFSMVLIFLHLDFTLLDVEAAMVVVVVLAMEVEVVNVTWLNVKSVISLDMMLLFAFTGLIMLMAMSFPPFPLLTVSLLLRVHLLMLRSHLLHLNSIVLGSSTFWHLHLNILHHNPPMHHALAQCLSNIILVLQFMFHTAILSSLMLRSSVGLHLPPMTYLTAPETVSTQN